MAGVLKPLLCMQQETLFVWRNVTKCPHTLRAIVLGSDINNRSYRARSELERQRGLVRCLVDSNVRPFSSESQQGDLVYKGRIGHLFKILKIFSLTTSSVGLAVQPYLMVTSSNMPLAAALPMFGAINMFVFLNPILIHFVAKKYVSELYFNPQSGMFTAVLMTFFARRMHFTFKATDVKVPDVPSPFAMFSAKGKPLFVHEADFHDLEAYKHLMGFDQPLNILCDEDEKQNKDD